MHKHEHHKFHMRLPRGKREYFMFMMIISIISVNIIAPLITMLELGFSLATWASVLKILPFIWICVVVLVLLTNKPAQWLTNKIILPTDSFNAHIIVNILCCVFMMSIVLTIVAMWIASKEISLEPIQHFIYRWPRNCAISFIVEALLAQPIARFVMHHYHVIVDRSKEALLEG
ncbi:MAG: hypothetical protein LBN22_12030 [Clostridiales Family XIII bacterium]|nr:hypothetical protein [Clostridiales Family XIII bacterium]